MTDRKSTSGSGSNPFFDAWMSGSEQMMKAQANWFTNVESAAESENVSEVVDLAKQNWQQCEAQFNSWVSASDQWFPKSMKMQRDNMYSSAGDPVDAFEKLKLMLNPATFLSSGIDELNQVFQRLADGPDFADIGVLEKKFMRTGQDWSNLCNANAEYQTVISSAWAQAFDRYVKSEADVPQNESIDLDEMMQRWLKVANESLIEAQRSDEFLAAQRKLFKTNTQYKLKQREIIEAWCEAYTMPTRSEVDDLHRMVYELRRELRQLKKQAKQTESEALKAANKAPTAKAKAPSAKKKSPQAKKEAAPKVKEQNSNVTKETPQANLQAPKVTNEVQQGKDQVPQLAKQAPQAAFKAPEKVAMVKSQPANMPKTETKTKKAANPDTTTNRKPL
jgi:polyhydroxyalkanoate synthesis regulator phasin